MIAHISAAFGQANIPIYPLTDVDKPYFSDPYHVPYQNNQRIYIAGTTHQYLKCDNKLEPQCASKVAIDYSSNSALNQSAREAGATICSAAGIHPYQSGSKTDSGDTRSWDAVVTLHVQNTSDCNGISGWSIIVHAHPEDPNHLDTPPTSWIGDKLLVGSFSENVNANYDGKYFRIPAGQLYLVYQKAHEEKSKDKKVDGVVAHSLSDPKTPSPGAEPQWLLLPDEDLNSENYVLANDGKFKLIETGNILTINNTFIMAYSVGAFFNTSYKLGIAYSDTFLGPYRKVYKKNPDQIWGLRKRRKRFGIFCKGIRKLRGGGMLGIRCGLRVFLLLRELGRMGGF
ncbi:hypothetical protein HII31_10936 [Pseudocercospora fuligena]|uniref:Uncharacterized protein n=1 Tax=Pseudocercospora fuligena TaxID=685502 RepID=A0A8H6RBW1_9PEZI|nr:hypothetical protein HII31_10936 [Pseudocercospora fuligena]